MYGFPLTIYFLTSVLPVEIPLVPYNGHLWATLLGYGPVGAAVEMAIGYTFVGTGLVMIITGWRQVYFSTQQLLTDGISHVFPPPQSTGISQAIFTLLIHCPNIPTHAPGPDISEP